MLTSNKSKETIKGLYLKRKGYKSRLRKPTIPHNTLYINIMCRVFNVRLSDIKGNSRNRKHVQIRHIVFWYLYNSTYFSLETIGAILNRDHATVLYALGKHKNLTETNDDIYLPRFNDFIKYINQ